MSPVAGVDESDVRCRVVSASWWVQCQLVSPVSAGESSVSG